MFKNYSVSVENDRIERLLRSCIEALIIPITQRKLVKTRRNLIVFRWKKAIRKIIFISLLSSIKIRLLSKRVLNRKASFTDDHLGLTSKINNRPQRSSMMRQSIDDSHILENTNSNSGWNSSTTVKHAKNGALAELAKSSRRLSVDFPRSTSIRSSNDTDTGFGSLPSLNVSSKEMHIFVPAPQPLKLDTPSPQTVTSPSTFSPPKSALNTQNDNNLLLQAALQSTSINPRRKPVVFANQPVRSALPPLKNNPDRTAKPSPNSPALLRSVEDIHYSSSDSEESSSGIDSDEEDSVGENAQLGELRASLENQLPQLTRSVNGSKYHNNHTNGLRQVHRVGSFKYTEQEEQSSKNNTNTMNISSKAPHFAAGNESFAQSMKYFQQQQQQLSQKHQQSSKESDRAGKELRRELTHMLQDSRVLAGARSGGDHMSYRGCSAGIDRLMVSESSHKILQKAAVMDLPGMEQSRKILLSSSKNVTPNTSSKHTSTYTTTLPNTTTNSSSKQSSPIRMLQSANLNGRQTTFTGGSPFGGFATTGIVAQCAVKLHTTTSSSSRSSSRSRPNSALPTHRETNTNNNMPHIVSPVEKSSSRSRPGTAINNRNGFSSGPSSKSNSVNNSRPGTACSSRPQSRAPSRRNSPVLSELTEMVMGK